MLTQVICDQPSTTEGRGMITLRLTLSHNILVTQEVPPVQHRRDTGNKEGERLGGRHEAGSTPTTTKEPAAPPH